MHATIASIQSRGFHAYNAKKFKVLSQWYFFEKKKKITFDSYGAAFVLFKRESVE